jgi:hypothetical protein
VPPSVYGRLVAASDVEEAAQAQLYKWMADYLAEVERHHALAVGSLPFPRSWVISSDVEKMPEDQTPALRLASPGLIGDLPTADGRGVYSARWQLIVAVQIAARADALRLARLYALAVRSLLLQQQVLDGLDVRRINWLDERYRLLDSVDDRTVCISEVELSVEVSDVTTRHAGPAEPILAPGDLGPDSPSWPTAQTADVALVKVPLDEEP